MAPTRIARLVTEIDGHEYSIEAFPVHKLARPSLISQDQDQKWLIIPAPSGQARIHCSTRNKGVRALVACPSSDVIRPDPIDESDPDQLWKFIRVDSTKFRVCCTTTDGEEQCLEAFVSDKVIRPRTASNSPGQLWELRAF